MSELLKKKSLFVHGSVNKGQTDETIYQRAFYGQQVYPGPKVPQNPRVQNQQLQRLQFKASLIAMENLPSVAIDFYKSLVPKDEPKTTWRTIFQSLFIKNRLYGQAKYGVGLYSAINPDKPVRRYDSTKYGDGFFSRPNTLPVDNETFRAKYGDFNLGEIA